MKYKYEGDKKKMSHFVKISTWWLNETLNSNNNYY